MKEEYQQMMPVISVVIATFNRCDVLKVTLERLMLQTVSPSEFEVLVVDDGSGDGTAEMVKSMIATAPYELRYYWHENRGPGFTENRGIREARGNLVLLLADDIRVAADHLEQHIKTHEEYRGENYAVMGKVAQSPELPQTVMQKNWDPFRYERFEGKKLLDNIYFYACNISVKKNFLLRNGMFRERKGAAHEDVELGYRLGRKGFKIVYNEKALAWHYHEVTLSSACTRAYVLGRNMDMLSDSIPRFHVFSVYKLFTVNAGLKAMLKMLPHEIMRRSVFNAWSVKYFWLPVLGRADTSRVAVLFARRVTYRGTVYHHVRKGYEELKKQKRKQLSDRKKLGKYHRTKQL